ncbi:MAG: hypothetical protein GY737_01300 [Desulfobacteraceae bacterium]|nr:hypothetical protein [Desulfobacteraceae bacterium]
MEELDRRNETRAGADKDSLPGLRKRSAFDRRSGDDRRQVYNMDHFQAVGIERRLNVEGRRKILEEKRRNWVRVTRWSSVYVTSKALFY